ncbi:MAG: mechanosensitive ion channel family protein [Deltaproteobacteria bacterium]|nr:mechanosensitive ion channel family protein [Deltaproteobacteria bacterium]NCP03608.1 mechanosensitive ion channel family protein [Deltaproteobacteria bacterium]NCP78521.1 mechanosensitive ion channel family protein [Desulfuromonadales bacterium]
MSYVNDFWNNNATAIIALLYQLALVVAVFFACRIGAKLVVKGIRRVGAQGEALDETLLPVLCAFARYGVYTIGLIVVLDIFGFNTNSIIALLGAAGLAIGLALKDTLSNIAAGIMLLIQRPFRIGHFIECNSFAGSAKEIGLFNTILTTADGLYLSMPNSTLWGSPLKNFTCNGTRRMDLSVGIAYGDSIDIGLGVLREIVAAEPRYLADPAPQFIVQALGDSSVNLQLRAWAKVEDYWGIYWANNKIMKEKIEAAGLHIPFPQRDVHMIEK